MKPFEWSVDTDNISKTNFTISTKIKDFFFVPSRKKQNKMSLTVSTKIIFFSFFLKELQLSFNDSTAH